MKLSWGLPVFRSRRLRRAVKWASVAVAGWYALCCIAMALYRRVDPPVTGVQLQRRLEGVLGGSEYAVRQRRLALEQIPVEMQHAVIAAEDGSFYQHSGVDWEEFGLVLGQHADGKRLRGASTISQQLVKNLFLTTHSSPLRKIPEYALVPALEAIVPKDRILELYLNEIEWGDGVWGIGAAAEHHYGKAVEQLSKREAARLAACIPAPRTRHPKNMDKYSATILERMRSRGW